MTFPPVDKVWEGGGWITTKGGVGKPTRMVALAPRPTTLDFEMDKGGAQPLRFSIGLAFPIGKTYALQMVEALVLAFLAGGLAGAGAHFLLSWAMWRWVFELAGLVDDLRDRSMRETKKRAAEASVQARQGLIPTDQILVDQVLQQQPRRPPWWNGLTRGKERGNGPESQ